MREFQTDASDVVSLLTRLFSAPSPPPHLSVRPDRWRQDEEQGSCDCCSSPRFKPLPDITGGARDTLPAPPVRACVWPFPLPDRTPPRPVHLSTLPQTQLSAASASPHLAAAAAVAVSRRSSAGSGRAAAPSGTRAASSGQVCGGRGQAGAWAQDRPPSIHCAPAPPARSPRSRAGAEAGCDSPRRGSECAMKSIPRNTPGVPSTTISNMDIGRMLVRSPPDLIPSPSAAAWRERESAHQSCAWSRCCGARRRRRLRAWFTRTSSRRARRASRRLARSSATRRPPASTPCGTLLSPSSTRRQCTAAKRAGSSSSEVAQCPDHYY